MRDQERDKGARGNLSQLLVDLPLNRSRSSQLSCLGSGIPSREGGGKGRWIGSRGDAYASYLSIGFLSFEVSGEGDKGEAPKMELPPSLSVISKINLLFLFTSTQLAAYFFLLII